MVEAVKGTRDILPGEIDRWHYVEDAARDVFGLYGFREIRTPIFESTELFQRGIGEATDIVAKEMYTFSDRKGRSLTLRPEGTAPVARAFIEHGLERGGGIQRLYYVGPMFRYERPQKGRMRQFSQIGAEVLGSDHPAVDAEVLEMLARFLERIGIGTPEILINSVGCPDCRPGYRDRLVAFLGPQRDRMCDDCRRRIDGNPLRCFDCKVPADQDLLQEAPRIADHLCAACRGHFEAVRGFLDLSGIAHRIEPRLVRGLDYYRRTAFEVVLSGLGAQNALLGGGRYDGLVEALGGPPVPGFGFAVGLDRLVLSLPEGAPIPVAAPAVVGLALGDGAVGPILRVAGRLRAIGRRVVFDPQPGRSLKSQLRGVHDRQARFALIVGDEEVAAGLFTLRDMRSGSQERLGEDDLIARLREVAGA
jgi:histidyl-tRNA synthetase